MEEGTSIRSQPANFAKESNPASRLVEILLKDHIQYKRAIYKRQKGKNTHTRATLTQAYLKKRNHSETNKGDRGEQREGRNAHSSKVNSEPKKTVVQPTKATEGEQREGRHTHSSQKKNNKKQSQEDHSTANKGYRGILTRTTLRKTEMKRVTNDLTDTAIGSPLSLEKTALAPRPKAFNKQR